MRHYLLFVPHAAFSLCLWFTQKVGFRMMFEWWSVVFQSTRMPFPQPPGARNRNQQHRRSSPDLTIPVLSEPFFNPVPVPTDNTSNSIKIETDCCGVVVGFLLFIFFPVLLQKECILEYTSSDLSWLENQFLQAFYFMCIFYVILCILCILCGILCVRYFMGRFFSHSQWWILKCRRSF